ncbi:hypothetical protein [Stenotrophomonas maltophilia]|uniref:hypothetical protein n=1 Tax=Stenotrophomonas maltophilia TaxID=40324 RepID=UPI0015DE9926|nr:hypothetical protein [Stenotrophomonas maltophilia]
MKPISCAAAPAFALTGVATTAMASDAYLSPNTNGGSGAMPSGYKTLHFELQNGDWAEQLALPEAPGNGDGVELTSGARWNSRVNLTRTTLADLVYLPVEAPSHLRFQWLSGPGMWEVLSSHTVDGTTRSISLLSEQGLLPSSPHLVTLVQPAIRTNIAVVQLPERASSQAVLAFDNGRQKHSVDVKGASTPYHCAAGQVCTFVFDADDGQWHSRTGRAQVQPAAHLPAPQQRWTDVVVGSLAEDIVTPAIMQLPAQGVDGDIYQISNPSGDHYARISPANTNLVQPAPINLKQLTFRYEAAQRRWVYQNN